MDVDGTMSAETAGRQAGCQADGALRSGKPCAAAGLSRREGGVMLASNKGAHTAERHCSWHATAVTPAAAAEEKPVWTALVRAIRRCALTSALHLLHVDPTWLGLSGGSDRHRVAGTRALVGATHNGNGASHW